MFRAMAKCHDSNTHYPKLPKSWRDPRYTIDFILAVRVGFEDARQIDGTQVIDSLMPFLLLLPRFPCTVTPNSTQKSGREWNPHHLILPIAR